MTRIHMPSIKKVLDPDPFRPTRGCLNAVLMALVIWGLLSLFVVTTCRGQEPSFGEDAAWIAGGAVAYELGANALNLTEWHRGRSYDWPDPFQTPKADYGCLPLCAGEESHYVTWAALGAGMTLRGHPWWRAWLLSGVWGNVVWEFGVESSYTRPSGHDVVINAGAALLGVAVVELVEAL